MAMVAHVGMASNMVSFMILLLGLRICCNRLHICCNMHGRLRIARLDLAERTRPGPVEGGVERSLVLSA